MAIYSSTPRDLTFGIELEFIAVFPQGVERFRIGELDNDIMSAISLAINSMGIKATDHPNDNENTEDDSEPYDSWKVSDEYGLLFSEAELQVFCSGPQFLAQGVEVTSRKMWFEENWQSELATVLSVFDNFRALGCRFITNGTTGLHVHVGFGNARMPLRTAKGVLQLCTAFEDRFDFLYPTNRIDEESYLKYEVYEHFNANLSWHFSQNIRTGFPKKMCHWLAKIEECTSFAQLGAFFENPIKDHEIPANGFVPNVDIAFCGAQKQPPSPETMSKAQRVHFTLDGHFSTVNLDNLYKDSEDKVSAEPMGTIEFRQHAGTLESLEIHAHVELLKTLLIAQVSDPNFHLINLLQAIGANDQLLSRYVKRFSSTTQRAQELKASDSAKAVELYYLKSSTTKPTNAETLDALEAQSLSEKWQRSHPDAVAKKIESKHLAGAYADLRTKPLDIPSEYMKLVQRSHASAQDFEQFSTMARAMLFRQLDFVG